ncbi:hypothetical protein B0H13DRAFT_2059029, partial [Mycena leptocephala]
MGSVPASPHAAPAHTSDSSSSGESTGAKEARASRAARIRQCAAVWSKKHRATPRCAGWSCSPPAARALETAETRGERHQDVQSRLTHLKQPRPPLLLLTARRRLPWPGSSSSSFSPSISHCPSPPPSSAPSCYSHSDPHLRNLVVGSRMRAELGLGSGMR